MCALVQFNLNTDGGDAVSARQRSNQRRLSEKRGEKDPGPIQLCNRDSSFQQELKQAAFRTKAEKAGRRQLTSVCGALFASDIYYSYVDMAGPMCFHYAEVASLRLLMIETLMIRLSMFRFFLIRAGNAGLLSSGRLISYSIPFS